MRFDPVYRPQIKTRGKTIRNLRLNDKAALLTDTSRGIGIITVKNVNVTNVFVKISFIFRFLMIQASGYTQSFKIVIKHNDNPIHQSK